MIIKAYIYEKGVVDRKGRPKPTIKTLGKKETFFFYCGEKYLVDHKNIWITVNKLGFMVGRIYYSKGILSPEFVGGRFITEKNDKEKVVEEIKH